MFQRKSAVVPNHNVVTEDSPIQKSIKSHDSTATRGSSKKVLSIIGFMSLGAALHATFLHFHSPLTTSTTRSINPVQTNDNNNNNNRNEAPFSSILPSKTSFHPKYKLWTEMFTNEQEEAMKPVKAIMGKYANLIAPKDKGLNGWKEIKHGTCVFDTSIGKDGHTLCGPAPELPCTFISFGINDNYSFDTEVAKWGCRGFAADPTVHHPSKIHPNVTFHNIGAVMLQDNEERLNDKGGAVEWWMTSFPKLRSFLGIEKIDVLKIDCEGCEVSLSRDILREDPDFLKRVDQISIETHVTKTWMTTREHVYYFGMLLILLEEAGFQMEWSSVFGCAKRHEITGCIEDVLDAGWPCGHNPWPGHPNVVKGYSCQEYTWKRY